MDTGDTAFILIATAMVMLMTPGLALFYGGMVRSKNVLSTVLQSFVCLGVVSIIWVVYGYSLAFGPDVNGLWTGRVSLGSVLNPASTRQPSPICCFARFS